MTATAKITTCSTMQDVLERKSPTPRTDPEQFVRLPGLFQRWEIEEELAPGSEFYIEAAGDASDGTPLFAAYWSEEMTPEMAQVEDLVNLAETEEFQPQTTDGECRTRKSTMTATARITKRSTMQDVLEAYPSAQRALFRRYHIGGCNSCGYQPEDILEAVAHRHNITDLDEVLEFIEDAEPIDRRIQVSPADVATALRSSTPPRLIDVRTPEEWELAHIAGATLMTEALAEVMKQWPKDTAIVFYCHLGQRSLDAASYFAGHGYKNVQSMTGGIDAWSLEVDSSVPGYEGARDPVHGKATLQPLRSVVSQAAGCQK